MLPTSWKNEGARPMRHHRQNEVGQPTKHHRQNEGHGVACGKTRDALVVSTVDVDCIVRTFVAAFIDDVSLALYFFLQAGQTPKKRIAWATRRILSSLMLRLRL